MGIINVVLHKCKSLFNKVVKVNLQILPVSVILIIILLIAVYHRFPSYNFKDLTTYLSGFSTVGLLILTAFYVLYTNQQISELKKQRQLQIQPLPNIVIRKGKISKPRLTCSYPENAKLGLVIDFCFEVTMKNIGNGAAILVDSFCEFVGNKIKTRAQDIMAHRFTVIEQGKEIKIQESIRDEYFEAINVLNKGVKGHCAPLKTAFDVLIRYTVMYRNILGAIFVLRVDYFVAIDNENQQKLSNWLASINSFETEFSADIAKHNAVFQRNEEESLKVFSEIKDKVKLRFPEEDVDIDLLEYSQSFRVKEIDLERFEAINKRIRHGIPIGRSKPSKDQAASSTTETPNLN